MEELKKVKDSHNIGMLNEMENDLKKAKEEYTNEIETLKSFYEKLIVEKTNQVGATL
jgi:hypothetical protein